MAQHIRKLNIDSFRGIQSLSLDNLGDINILVGDNNSGKTSVLEAILLISNPSDFGNIVNVSRMRERHRILFRSSPTFYDSFVCMFNKTSEEMKLSISGKVYDRKVDLKIHGNIEKLLIDIEELVKYSPSHMKEQIKEDYIASGGEIEGFNGELSYYIQSDQLSTFDEHVTKPINYHRYIYRIGFNKKKPVINTMFLSTIDHIVVNTFRNITRDTEVTKKVVDILKIFDEDISNLKIIQDDEGRFIQTVEHKLLGNMPLSVYGDGIKKVIALANGIVAAKDGILLIDEVETSIHKSAMKKVFSWLVESSKKFNVQLFLTTHSLEAVDEILNSNPIILGEDMVRVITLVKKSDQTVARILSGEKAMQVREDYDMELRK